MAKINSLAVRKARGSMGGMTYSVMNGQQIVKEKAVNVKNPQTVSQMNQRVKIANVVALYRANRVWMEKWAFAQRPEKWSLYNAYMSENLAKSVISLTKKENDYRVGIVEPLTFTKGTLPTIGLTFVNGNTFQSSIKILLSASLATIGSLSRGIVSDNPEWQEGDQLSMVVMKQKMATVAYEPGIGGTPIPVIKPIVETSVAELTLDFNDDTPIEDTDFELVLSQSEDFRLRFTPEANQLDGNEVAIGVMVCQSRKSGGTILVSTQAPVLNNYNTFNTYASAEQRSKARASYGGESTIPFLVPEIPATDNNSVVTLTGFNFPVECSALDNATINLNTGASGIKGLRYLKEHLTFKIQNEDQMVIREFSGDPVGFFLYDGQDRFNQISYSEGSSIYTLGEIVGGPTLEYAMWDGIRI